MKWHRNFRIVEATEQLGGADRGFSAKGKRLSRFGLLNWEVRVSYPRPLSSQPLEGSIGQEGQLAYCEELAERVRFHLSGRTTFSERKMFGGLTFMVNAHMRCGIVGDDLMVRVGSEAYADSLRQPHVREMDFAGKALKGMVYIGIKGVEQDTDLRDWIARGLDFVQTVPPRKE